MITIYHLGKSQSDRIVWLMEELDLPYQLEWYNRLESQLAPPEYLRLHPAATAPVIKDGDKVLAESSAIVEYISRKYGDARLSLGPSDDRFADYLYWMTLNANLQSCFFVRAVAGDQAKPDSPVIITSKRRAHDCVNYLEEYLGNNVYLAGDQFSCADIMSMWPINRLEVYTGINLNDKPNIRAYIERIGKRPAYRKAMKIAGPDAIPPTPAKA